MYAYLDTTGTPAGPITFAVNEAGALVGLQFVEGHYRDSLEDVLRDAGFELAADPLRTAAVRRQLDEYTAGTRQTFELPLAFSGTPWQLTVWDELTRIPYGTRRTYAEVAVLLGRPTSARAVGSANAANRLPLVVPCHRVVGADGALTGFAGGMHLKERLLAHEARVAAVAAR